MIDRLTDSIFRNFIYKYPVNLVVVFYLFRDMSGNSLSLTVRVGREIDLIGQFCLLFYPLNDLSFTFYDDVVGLEVIIQVNAKLAFGQVFNMAHRGHDVKVFA